MSELSELTAAHDSAALPGYVLSRLDLGDFGELESKLEGRAIALAAAAATNLPRDLGERVMMRALDDCMAGLYSYGGAYFDAWAKSAKATPVLAHLSLLKKHGDMTEEKAAALLKDRPGASSDVLKMAGYAPTPKKTDPPPGNQTSPSPGGPSSKPSDAPETESPASVTTKSAA